MKVYYRRFSLNSLVIINTLEIDVKNEYFEGTVHKSVHKVYIA